MCLLVSKADEVSAFVARIERSVCICIHYLVPKS
jgi:hypothetical protein